MMNNIYRKVFITIIFLVTSSIVSTSMAFAVSENGLQEPDYDKYIGASSDTENEEYSFSASVNDMSKLPILIISSYNPETVIVSNNIRVFQETCDSLGILNPIVVENMNCKSFSESKLWRSRFQHVLNKYRNKYTHELNIMALVCLGQEAWMSFISDDINYPIPVLAGLVSGNSIYIPDQTDSINLKTYMPESVYLTDISSKKRGNNIITGAFYEYDIISNLEMIRHFYPNTQRIALLTDNTLGGVALQSHVINQMALYNKKLDLILLDGRRFDTYAMKNMLSTLPDNTVLLIGTWRVDKNENYFISNGIYDLKDVNPNLPAFSLSSTGLGKWAIGGIIPMFLNQGQYLAERLETIIKDENTEGSINFRSISNVRTFDSKILTQFGFKKSFSGNAVYINERTSLFERHPLAVYIIYILTFSIFIISCIIVYFWLKTKKVNNILLDSEHNNRIIMENVNIGMIFISPDHTILMENCGLINELKSYKEMRKGTICYESKYGYNTPCRNCPMNIVIESDIDHYERTVTINDRIYLEVFKRISNRNNNFLGLVVRIEDITEDENNRKDLIAAKETAENANRLKSLFLANMSHEIRTPLNAIIGFSELLANTNSKEEMDEYIKIIETNNSILLQLISDILDISKIEAGTLEFNIEEVNLVDIINSACKIFRLRCEMKGLQIIEDVPLESIIIISDANRLSQVICNFINNSLKFTNTGYIKVGAEILDDYYKVYVEDTGIGIASEKIDTIFERFVKLNSFSQGTGLGLPICKMIINRFNGQIGVESELGKGSKFWFTIPKNMNKNVFEKYTTINL